LFINEYTMWKSGFPDLSLWKQDSVKFVEVKGPRDKLMSSQSCWLRQLMKIGIPCEILKIK